MHGIRGLFGIPHTSEATWSKAEAGFIQKTDDPPQSCAPSEAEEHVPDSNRGTDDHSPPPKDNWTCNSPYTYPVKELPKNPWKTYDISMEERDRRLCGDLKEEITFLMVVAGLFLAVVTAFTVESYKWLQEDKEDKMSDLLVEVVRLLNNTGAQGSARLPEPFIPDHTSVVVNQLWFLSMILDLAAVLIGSLCLQWISSFSRTYVTGNPDLPSGTLVTRQLRYNGMITWGVVRIPEVLLLIVQASIVLFTIGFVYLVWNINHPAAFPTVVMAGIAGAYFFLVNIIPFFQSLVGSIFPTTVTVPPCPYKSPTSWLLHSIFAAILVPIKALVHYRAHHAPPAPDVPLVHYLHREDIIPFNSFTKRIVLWIRLLPWPLTNYFWKRHDDNYVTIRALYRPETDSFSKSSYYLLARRLLSFKMQLHDNLSILEKALLVNKVTLLDGDGKTSGDHIKKLRHDFVTAHLLRHIAQHNVQLRRDLVHHRVELYIRIKNSIQGVSIANDRFSRPLVISIPDQIRNGRIGRSLVCPLTEFNYDISGLPKDLKFQFLSCAIRLIGTEHFTDQDVVAAALVIESEGLVKPMTCNHGDEKPPEAQPQLILEKDEHPTPPTDQQPTQEVSELGDTRDSVTGDIQSTGNSVEGVQLTLADLCYRVGEKLQLLCPSDFTDIRVYWHVKRIFDIVQSPPDDICANSHAVR